MSAVSLPVAGRRATFPVGAAAATGLVGAAAIMTVALPLLVYSTSLALFGIGHVISELNYIDRRFSSRLGRGIGWRTATPIVLAVAAHSAALAGLLTPRAAVMLELAAAAGLALGVISRLTRYRAIGAAIALVLAAGAIALPFQLLLVLAILHNLTPLGFFVEVLTGAARRRALLLAVPLIAVPLVIATGLPFAGLAWLGLAIPEARLLASGPLALNMGVYVPASAIATDWALPLFSAAVFAQIMHYAAVIVLLPRLAAGGSTPTVFPWPRGGWLVPAIAAVSIAFALGFALDFGLARRVYALAALVHSWIEIPILLIAWGGVALAQPAKA